MTELEVLTEVPTAPRLFWIGLYEDSNKLKWFFQVDFAPTIGYFAMRVVWEGKHIYSLLAVWR